MGEYFETGHILIGDGEQFSFIDRYLPDFRTRGTANNMALTCQIKGTNFPQQEATTKSTTTIMSDTGQKHVRVRSREIVVRIDGTGTGYGWTMGELRLDFRTDGRR
jgi:hypothetical protein